MSSTTETDARYRKTVAWIVALATLTILFDGYDLVVYGTILPILMDDPEQLGQISAQQAGMLGSWALIGVMIGALVNGAIGDYLGRRRLMLVNIMWFSTGMALAALSTSIETFAVLRFFTGIGIGGLLATTAALVAECVPAEKKNLYNAIVYSGVPAGGILAAVLAIALRDVIGWRGLFLIGALPVVILLPLAFAKLPESPRWLVSRGRLEEAALVHARTGIPLPSPDALEAEKHSQKVGFAALATRRYALGTTLLGIMSFVGLMLTYGLTTWLPKIMADAGYNAKGSLLFLVVLNGGAVFGTLIASRYADRRGPQHVVATTFGLAAVALVLFTMGFPIAVLLALVAVAGTGTIGTQVLIYGFVSNYYSTNARAAGVAWCAGFGRLGGIFGPIIGGSIVTAGLSNSVTFYIFAGVAIVGMLVTLFVPRSSSGTGTAQPALAPNLGAVPARA
ncbi:MFS transporter [Aldersonia kunmingensis]|uniref:MFS transporter n=1 Tax=Aldersonia kunmingensis TaxID=408066 RepID=UPI00082E3A63|nr:aromatic acid/H+ symport family MFS transporter [Aldersonia kunmingensis]